MKAKIKVIIKRNDELVGHVTNISISRTALLRRFPFGFVILRPVNSNFMILQDKRKPAFPDIDTEDVILTNIYVEPDEVLYDYLDMCELTDRVIEEYKKACHEIDPFKYCKLSGPFCIK